MVKNYIDYILWMVSSIEVRGKRGALVAYWVNWAVLTIHLTHDIDLGDQFWNSCISEIVDPIYVN